MIDLYKLYDEFCGQYNTHQGGHVRPERDFTSWVNTISMSIFKEYAEANDKTQSIHDALRPFFRSVFIRTKPIGRDMVAPYPADYEKFGAARAVVLNEQEQNCPDMANSQVLTEEELQLIRSKSNGCEYSIEGPIDSQRWGALCSHAIKKPSLSKSRIYLSQTSDGFKIAPKEINGIILDYYRLPIPGTFVYSVQNPNTEQEYIQYDANASVQLEWGQSMFTEFLNRLGTKYGQKIREPFLIQTANNEKNTSL